MLLDIGAVWCHWCHVMDGESYENPELAGFLNEHFVCIKVDRDERPDVDARYQRAVQTLTQQGGWPLTGFLTPEGEVFFGGTYFPPDGKYGRPGFRTVLASVLDAYRARPRPGAGPGAGDPAGPGRRTSTRARRAKSAPALLDAAVDQMARVFDPVNGGFGSQPKFPHPGALTLLLHRWYDQPAEQIRSIIDRTLQGMARGGMYDQLGGGFHRYSVDATLDRPALREDVLRQLGAAEGLPRRLRAVRHRGVRRGGAGDRALGARGDWPIRRGATPPARTPTSGSTTTATTSPGPATRRPRCSPRDELEVAAAYYDIGTAGEMHHNPGKNVLFVAATAPGRGPAHRPEPRRPSRPALARRRTKLRAARARRTGAVRRSHPLHQLERHDGLGHAARGGGAGRRVVPAPRAC